MCMEVSSGKSIHSAAKNLEKKAEHMAKQNNNFTTTCSHTYSTSNPSCVPLCQTQVCLTEEYSVSIAPTQRRVKCWSPVDNTTQKIPYLSADFGSFNALDDDQI